MIKEDYKKIDWENMPEARTWVAAENRNRMDIELKVGEPEEKANGKHD